MPPPHALSSPIELFRAIPEQARALTEIALAAKSSWHYPAAWLRAWESQLTVSPEFIRHTPTFVALRDRTPLAWAAVNFDTTDAHLEHLWVHPAAMHQGLGRTLFRHIETIARAHHATRLLILSDPHAENFYFRLGAFRLRLEPAPVCGIPRFLPLLSKPLGPSV